MKIYVICCELFSRILIFAERLSINFVSKFSNNIMRLFQISSCLDKLIYFNQITDLEYEIWSLKNRYYEFFKFFQISLPKLQLCFHVQIQLHSVSFYVKVLLFWESNSSFYNYYFIIFKKYFESLICYVDL